MDVNGSPEYALTWSTWDMPSGPPICRLRASARRISASGCSGWPTPATIDHIHATNEWRGMDRAIAPTGKLSDAVQGVAGWPTPQGFDASNNGEPRALRLKTGHHRNPEKFGNWWGTLKDHAALAGWPTPVANDDNKSVEAHLAMKARMGGNRTAITSLQVTAQLAGWQTPRGEVDAKNPYGTKSHPKRPDGGQPNLAWEAQLAGWATPTQRDHKDGANTENVPVNALLGRQAHLGPMPSGSPASTEKRGALNPAFSLWLQGYPTHWMASAPSAVSARSGARGTR